MKDKPDNRRWYGFTRVENALQIRHVSRVILCAAIYVVISSVLFVAFYVDRIGPWAGEARTLTLGWVLSMAGMSALFALLVGVYVTRRIAGPIHRIKSDLLRFLQGDESVRIRLRGRDEMTDVADLINLALQARTGSEGPEASSATSALRAELRKIVEEIRAPDRPSSETLEDLGERLELLATREGPAQ